MTTHLESLKQHSIVVADTGDIDAIARFRPMDATTNPSLLRKAETLPAYAMLLDDASAQAGGNDRIGDACDRLAVAIGGEILKLVPGRVSTEVDARLSFDTDATLAQARRLVALYDDAGIGRERLLIKIAATWEGIRAAERLERKVDSLTEILGLFVQHQLTQVAHQPAFDPETAQLGRVGLRTMIYYMVTTLMAVINAGMVPAGI